MNRFKIAIAVFACLVGTARAEPASPSNAAAVAQIEQIVQTFQQCLIKKDATTLGALFLPENNSWLSVADDATFASVKAKHPEAGKVWPSSYKEFVDFVGKSKEPIEEKFSNVHIDTNGTVAAVYFDFVFLENGVINNRGSESWHMVKTEGGWKISSMIYSVGR